ncbi:MAG TPA: EF-P beta-lysylation protein EpmB [Planctomycetota bacterium]|nr:EF-P beta-lysylation protein EpmB [Planctomycetota bacterium]
MNDPFPMKGDTLAGSPPRASGHATAECGWRRELAEAIRDPAELLRALDLPMSLLPAAERAAALFPVLAPRGFVARMRQGDVHDPLLRQVLPLGEETLSVPGFSADPLAETACGPRPGVLHKYHGRALLVTTGACAVHCRYCFRRHFAYDELPRGRRWWSDAVEYVRADVSLREVLLSGGDPLTLPDAQLAVLAEDFATIPHLERLRVHTRLPVVLPSRVDDQLLAWLTGTRLAPVVVIHANHPAEIADDVALACRRLRDAGVTVLNQSVLLRGINDDASVLAELSERLFRASVLPYYLHVLDHVAGAGHFLVDDMRARELHTALAARLPGYLVPRLVREEPGQSGKTPLR